MTGNTTGDQGKATPNVSRLARNRALHRDLFARAGDARYAFVVQPTSEPIWEIGDYTTSDRPIADFVPWVVEAYRRWVVLSEAVGDDAVPFARPLTGTHLYAVCFGAKPHFYPDNNPYAEACVASAAEADRIPEPVLEHCRPLMRVLELAAAVRRELGPDVTLGPPDMQTGFDTACILWDKTDLFYAMTDQPEAVQRLAGKCGRLLRHFIVAYRREFPNSTFGHCPSTWTPPDCGPWVSNDECGVMSPEMFETFCLPELVELSRQFNGIGMHCCANAQHQFEAFRRIPKFYAFNRVPTGIGWEKDNALSVLGGPEGPVMVPGWCSKEDVATQWRQAPPGTRFIFNSGGTDSPDMGREWLEAVRTIVTC
jgi:hypothetical protein